MALLPYQVSYAGLVLGDGTPYDIVDGAGFDSLPGVRLANVDRARESGQWPAQAFVTGRELLLNLDVTGPDDATFRGNVEALSAATVAEAPEQPLQFLFPGMVQASRQANARPTGRDIPLSLDYVHRIAKVALKFWATDHRIYDSAQQSVSVGLPVSNGGMAWPAVWPVGWGSTSGSGSFVAVNAGNTETRGVITITGPVDNPSVQNVTTGAFMTFLLSLVASDTLVIDLLNRTVLLNGSGNRRGMVSSDSRWLSLPPGSSTINYRANTVQVGSAMSWAWASAWE